MLSNTGGLGNIVCECNTTLVKKYASLLNHAAFSDPCILSKVCIEWRNQHCTLIIFSKKLCPLTGLSLYRKKLIEFRISLRINDFSRQFPFKLYPSACTSYLMKFVNVTSSYSGLVIPAFSAASPAFSRYAMFAPSVRMVCRPSSSCLASSAIKPWI